MEALNKLGQVKRHACPLVNSYRTAGSYIYLVFIVKS